LEEFEEYYSNVGASIEDDRYFETMIVSAWKLNGDASSDKKSVGFGALQKDKKPSGRRRPTSHVLKKVESVSQILQ
jgi:hypothetical protein